VRFSDDQDSVESERIWLLALEPEDGEAPGRFQFGEPIAEGTTAIFQRYDDADIETVSADIALRRVIDLSNPTWAWVLLGLAIAAYLVWFFMPQGGPGAAPEDESLRMPESVTPFSVLALLQRVRGAAPLAESQKEQLDADMRRIEASHFGKGDGEALELESIARNWLGRAQ